jgi:hypothetical protein
MRIGIVAVLIAMAALVGSANAATLTGYQTYTFDDDGAAYNPHNVVTETVVQAASESKQILFADTAVQGSSAYPNKVAEVEISNFQNLYVGGQAPSPVMSFDAAQYGRTGIIIDADLTPTQYDPVLKQTVPSEIAKLNHIQFGSEQGSELTWAGAEGVDWAASSMAGRAEVEHLECEDCEQAIEIEDENCAWGLAVANAPHSLYEDGLRDTVPEVLEGPATLITGTFSYDATSDVDMLFNEAGCLDDASTVSSGITVHSDATAGVAPDCTDCDSTTKLTLGTGVWGRQFVEAHVEAMPL